MMPGFTLRTYTHATWQMQQKAAEKMAVSWHRFDKTLQAAEHRKGSNFSPVLFWFFPRISL